MTTDSKTAIDARKLERVVAVMTYLRSGSGLMYSLLDNHPSVVSTPDCILTGFYEFWDKHGHLPANQLVETFIDYYAVLFDPREECQCPRVSDGWGQYSGFANLGPERDQHFEVDRDSFRNSMERIIGDESPVARKLFFQALHVAYTEALGRQVENPIIVFGLHTPGDGNVRRLLEDFPEADFLQMVRHPVLALGSAFRHRFLTGSSQIGRGAGAFIGRAISSATPLPPEGSERWRAVRLEELHKNPRETLQKICAWLDLPWDDRLLESTINGLQWWNESNSVQLSGFSASIANQRFEEYIPWFDRFRLSVLFAPRAVAWGYPVSRWHASIPIRVLTLPLLAFPFSLEIKAIMAAEASVKFQKIRLAGRAMVSGRKFLLRAWLLPFRKQFNEMRVL